MTMIAEVFLGNEKNKQTKDSIIQSEYYTQNDPFKVGKPRSRRISNCVVQV